MRTYDIINAGPKNRFMASGKIVSNSGRIFQPQNLPRSPDWFDEDVQALAVRAMKLDAEDLLWDNVSEICAFAVRGCIVAADRYELAIADLSNIEGRVLAWGAQEEWKIAAFKAYDRGEGPDLYKVTAGNILGKDPSEVTKEERQTKGKVPELAGGYGGGVGAYRKMGGPTFDAMDDDAITQIVRGWRAVHPRTTAFWYDMERAARRAIENPGDSFRVRDMAEFDVRQDQTGRSWLRMKLPSGRFLCYPDPEIVHEVCPRCDGEGEILYPYAEREVLMKCPECGGQGTVGKGQITYMGIDQYTRKWKRLETYYGKIVENWTQAVARDVFFSGMRRAMDAGFSVVLRVHDELVTEVPAGSGLTHEKLADLMATNDSWNVGLPLSAEGFTTRRYRKQ